MEKEECGENGSSKNILSDTEEAENIDAIISNLVKVRDFCHSKAKDNILAGPAERAEVTGGKRGEWSYKGGNRACG